MPLAPAMLFVAFIAVNFHAPGTELPRAFAACVNSELAMYVPRADEPPTAHTDTVN